MKTRTSAAFASPTIPISELQEGVHTLERTTQLDGGHTPAYGSITQSTLDSYQLALVPFQPGQGNAGTNFSRNTGTDQLFLLPFTLKDLVSRVQSEFGGLRTSQDNDVAEFGQVRVDFLSMEVTRSNRLVRLRALEFKVLKFFLLHPNQVVSREELLNEVWGYNNYPCTRTVDNHILRLRQKLESDVANPVHFRTVHGFGYKFTP